MTFDTVEESIQDARPAELYDFVTPGQTWRVTSYERDVVFGGNTYTSIAGAGRDAIMIDDIAHSQTAMAINIIASHAVARAFVNGVPPGSLAITMRRYYEAGGFSLQSWSGTVSAVSFKGRYASFHVPSGTSDALSADCPSVCATRHCNNILYDGMCTMLPASFQVSTTIASISADGKTIVLVGTVIATGGLVPWSLHGMITHTSSQEKRTIIGEAADRRTLTVYTQFPNGVALVGDAVVVNAGCDHTIDTCQNKFSNALNFGGNPFLPPSNIFYVGLLAAKYRS